MQKNREERQIEFRVLCNSSTIGGLKGANGNIIKSLERQTSSNISVNVHNNAFKHRVVHVIASSYRTRTVTLDGVESKVSPAQEGLLRVFDRIVELEAGDCIGGEVKCVLVVGPGMVGTVLGKGGSRIKEVVKETRVFVQILPLESPPPGAGLKDELIQITGDSLPVKKALVVISQFLQQKIVEETSSGFVDRSMKWNTRNALAKISANGGEEAEVIFKLLCPYEVAGYLIGYKGKIVRSMEEETGASICFSASDAGTHERVVTISAFENKKSQYSIAQNATVRVFNELVSSSEVANTKKGNSVTASLLILPYQSEWLSDGEVSFMSTIHNANGVTLKIMELTNLPVGAASDEKVLEINGDYPNVQTALFEVTWILRERIFNASLPKDCLPLLPHKLVNVATQENKFSALTDKMNDCRVSKEIDGSRPPSFPQSSDGSNITTVTVSSGESARANADSNFASQSFVVTNTKLEIAVREDVFNAVYGENGSNLARLRKISGATVEVEDPRSGSDGKVIISGTREQTMVAQSLLQAFLMTA